MYRTFFSCNKLWKYNLRLNSIARSSNHLIMNTPYTLREYNTIINSSSTLLSIPTPVISNKNNLKNALLVKPENNNSYKNISNISRSKSSYSSENSSNILKNAEPYLKLMRIDRPIGKFINSIILNFSYNVFYHYRYLVIVLAMWMECGIECISWMFTRFSNVSHFRLWSIYNARCRVHN